MKIEKKHYIWGAIIIAIILIYIYRKNISSMLGLSKDDGSTTRSKGGCVKHTGNNGAIWYTFGGLEVPKQDCIDKGYL